MKNLLLMILFLTGSLIYSQCTVNAGGNKTICGTSTTLQGTAGTNNNGAPTWTLVSKPSGAPDPVITGGDTLTPNVTGMTFPGSYVFQISQPCTTGPPATSQVTITAPGATTGFTAGPDITNVPASTGIANLSATIPAGYTPSWTYYNLNSFEFNSSVVTTNAIMTGTTTATPTLTLTKKSDHDIDPSYRVILRITSTINPSCWYEDDAIVRFVPNPNVSYPDSRSFCGNQSTIASSRYYYDENSSSPKFSDNTTNASANPTWGTTITMNVISQPAGGNLAYGRMQNGRLYFASSFNQTVGAYVFTLTISNSSGNYTTQQLTFNYNGSNPAPVSFVDAAYPEQMALYSAGSTGGAVYCNRAGTTTPITFYFKLDPVDSPTLTSTVTPSGIIPTGGAPSIVVNGAGSLNRSATLSPPSGGWRVGTYSFSVTLSNGTCNRSVTYYVHISDGNRPNVEVNNLTVCYPGSGVVSATIPLPTVYKGVVNPSYFQEYGGRYELTVVSKPAGSATPTFDPVTLRTFTNTSTVISNLNTQGEYVFKIKATPSPGGDPGFIAKEYTCSGTSDEDTFSIFVTTTVNSNAGSDQSVVGSTATLHGNNPGVVATGTWTLVSKPAGAPDPVIVSPTASDSNVTGLITAGDYTFRWTVATGACTSSDDTVLNVENAAPGGVTGSEFWVKSDDAGTIATGWKDISANANNIPAVGTWSLSTADRNHNFHPYTTGFTGSKYFLNATSVLNPTNGQLDNVSHSIFSAVRPTTAGTGRIIGIDDDGNGAEPGFSIEDGKLRLYKFTAGANADQFDEQPFNIGATNIVSGIGNNPTVAGGTSASAGGERVLGVNGVYKTYPNTTSTNRFHIQGQRLRIGDGAWTAPGPFPGDIMEVIWFKRPLLANEQSRVNSYLAVKNGVTLNENYLSTTNTVVWDRALNVSYNNNIFGIARDNITLLHQKQSGSINSNQKLVISTAGFADSNAANISDLATNQQYLITGDNGLKQSLTTPLSYTTGSNGVTNTRFESIWKVQNTNTVGNVIVAWPKGVTNLYLVQSSNEIFDGTDTFTPMTAEVTVNGVVYNTATVTLGNGQFFTFAGFAQAPGGVTGPDFWVKSDDAGTISTAWKDNSANADNIPNVGGITLSPADRNHNFYPYTSGYTGTKYFYNTNSVLNTTNVYTDPSMRSSVSVFSAVRPTSANGTGRITGIDDDANASEPGISINSGMPHIYKYFGNGGAQANSNTMSAANEFTTNKSSVFSAIQDQALNSGRGERRLGLDGIYETFNLGSTTNTFNVLGKHLRIGDAGWDSPGPFPGDIMEIVWYKRALTPNEQSRVNSYLAVKNGTTLNENYLSTNSSVVWDRTINSGFNNNIFGIAKDEFTALHQKQAGSVNNGQKLVISTTGFADSNAANSAGLVNDLQFLLTGDNGLKQSLTTPLSYTAGSNGIANYRFESIWKVQNTNTVGTVAVAWPKSVKNLYLVQSPDAAFDATDTFTPMTTEVTVNGVVYNTVNVTLGNGQFFTFAGFGNAPGGVATGLSYWYRADKNTTNTGATTDVTGWTDMWNGTTVGQMGTNLLPKYVEGTTNYFNFNPGINFTVNTQSLGNISVQTLTSLNYDIFTFTKEGMSGTRFFNIGRNNTVFSGNNWDSPAFEPGGNVVRRNNAGAGPVYWANPGNNYVTVIPSIAYTTFTDVNLKRGINGSTLLGPAGNHTAIGSVTGGHIFGRNSGTLTMGDDAGFIGHIGETIVYGAGTLSNTERRKVDSYLAIKYGITLGQVATDHYLDTDGNVVWNGADNTAYNSNIFGVGRDDIEAFEQKVSKSVNAGSILTVATTNDFALPNLDASRTGFADDKTYFLLGDNANAATTPIDVNLGSKTYKRIPKIWMAQEKNADTGNLFFEADLTTYNSVAYVTTSGNVVMLVSDDAAFTTNVVVVNPTVNNAGKWVYSQNIASGKYITFAVDPCYGPDTDGDGIPDMCDLDSDNDGITDCMENGFTNSTISNIFELNGTATEISNNEVRLTTASNNEAGEMWSYGKVDFNKSFTLSYDAYLGTNNGGADGIAAVFHNSPLGINAIGDDGYGLGARGIANGLVLEIDTYSNTEPVGDITNDHGQIWDSDNQAGSGLLTTAIDLGNLENGIYHNVVIIWNFSTKTLSYTVGGVNAGSYTFPVGTPITSYFGGESNVYFGFTASTGGSFNEQRVRFNNFCTDLPLELDTDNDGIPNHLDLDSDNDGCLDALEGSANFVAADLVTAGGTVTVGTGSTALNQNLCGNGICVDANGIPTVAGTGQDAGSSQNPLISSCQVACYKPGITAGTSLDTKVGITALNRAGATNSDNWPMTRKGGWLALEAKTKGFVPNRVAFNASGNPIGIPVANFVEGMMVYDSTNKCMKMYTLKDGDTSMDWHCISTQTCPD